MIRHLKLIPLLLTKFIFFFGQAHAAQELAVGDAAPVFNLIDQHQKNHSPGEYKGNWLVVYFYPKDDTPGCTKEACNFRDDIAHIRALNARVLGISLDDSKSHAEFAQKYSLPFPLLADPDGSTAEAYGALFRLGPIKFSKRHSFIIDPQGVVRKIYREVEPKQHSQQIIADLKTLIDLSVK